MTDMDFSTRAASLRFHRKTIYFGADRTADLVLVDEGADEE